jgi:hypothetical protein
MESRGVWASPGEADRNLFSISRKHIFGIFADSARLLPVCALINRAHRALFAIDHTEA